MNRKTRRHIEREKVRMSKLQKHAAGALAHDYKRSLNHEHRLSIWAAHKTRWARIAENRARDFKYLKFNEDFILKFKPIDNEPAE